MKKLILLASILLITFQINAQKKFDTLPPYLKVPYIPPFKIIQPNNSVYTKDSLPKKRPVVIMYFSPDCGHCQIQIQDILDSMQYFEKVQFVLVAYKKLDELKAFEEKYKLANYSNIRIGRDAKYFVPSFYQVKITPFIAVYNKKGEFLKAFTHGMKISELREIL